MRSVVEERQVRILLAIGSIVAGLIGLYFVARVDWRLAAGVFFLMWSYALQRRVT